jgi:hypothetical protein
MSFAPKDEHEAQVQFALERGIPAISAVMGTKRLPFPSTVFDVVHCARCRVPWHIEGDFLVNIYRKSLWAKYHPVLLLSCDIMCVCLAGGKLLLELDRLLRPGGYFVWSATPVYQKLPGDVEIWEGKFIEDSDIQTLSFYIFYPDLLLTQWQLNYCHECINSIPEIYFVAWQCSSNVCSNKVNVLENGQQSKG